MVFSSWRSFSRKGWRAKTPISRHISVSCRLASRGYPCFSVHNLSRPCNMRLSSIRQAFLWTTPSAGHVPMWFVSKATVCFQSYCLYTCFPRRKQTVATQTPILGCSIHNTETITGCAGFKISKSITACADSVWISHLSCYLSQTGL